MKPKDYNNIKWKEYFYLDESSPSGIRWLNSPRKGIPANQVAGNKFYKLDGRKSAWQVMLNNKSYVVHRIMWCMLNNCIDPMLVIDHIDGDPFNNTPVNLTVKTSRENGQNQKKYSTNKTGIVGVRYALGKPTETGYVPEYWEASWVTLEKKGKAKRFSCHKYGYDQAFALAVAYRAEQISLLNAAGASYTPRHCGLTPAEPPVPSPVQPT